jgi:ribosomal protein S18 acetylase RimI-like enzyme
MKPDEVTIQVFAGKTLPDAIRYRKDIEAMGVLLDAETAPHEAPLVRWSDDPKMRMTDTTWCAQYDPGAVCVAFYGAKPIGILLAMGARFMATYYIHSLFVSSKYRKHGVASKLNTAFEAYAKKTKYHYVVLNVHSNNTAAKRFYRDLRYDTQSEFMVKRLPSR